MPASWTSTSGRMPNLTRMQRKAFESFQQGDLAKAERLCAGLLEHMPDDFDTLHLLGMVNFRRHRLAEALRLLGAALKANPVSSEAMSNLGLALHTAGHYDEAISRYRSALQLEPGHPEFLYNLGNSYLELGRYDQAVASYDAALAARPDHVGALVNRGNTQLRLNAPLAALANYDAARELMPRHPQILTNRGHTLRRLDRPAEALTEFSAAIKSAPDFAEAHFEAAMAHITLGDFDAGWKAYEWRWKTGAFARQRRSLPAPLWLGDRPVGGKTILLHAEQGFGDTIQFIRFAPLLKRLGANVICEVQPELQPLLVQLDNVQVIAAGAPLPAFDLHCPLLSLPLAFKMQLETIPASIPYLSAPADRLARWPVSYTHLDVYKRQAGDAAAAMRQPPERAAQRRPRGPARSAEPGSPRRRVQRFRRYGRRDLAARCRRVRGYRSRASCRRAGQAGVAVVAACRGFPLDAPANGHAVVSDRDAAPPTGLWRLGQRDRSSARRTLSVPTVSRPIDRSMISD